MTLSAVSGPPFETVMVYVMFVPAVTDAGPSFTTPTSALATVSIVKDELFSSLGSFEALTVAVLLKVVPDGVPAGSVRSG